MSNTIYASFNDPHLGKQAAGALLDHGVLDQDLSLVVNEAFLKRNPDFWTNRTDEDKSPKHGITTTTGADAGAGAAKGAGIGLALGILGAIASLIIPGFGLVVGGGALATALGAAAGTAAAGAVSGGVLGYLKDQGVPEEHAVAYDRALNEGGAVLQVVAPSGKADVATIESLLAKYGALNTNNYAVGVRTI